VTDHLWFCPSVPRTVMNPKKLPWPSKKNRTKKRERKNGHNEIMSLLSVFFTPLFLSLSHLCNPSLYLPLSCSLARSPHSRRWLRLTGQLPRRQQRRHQRSKRRSLPQRRQPQSPSRKKSVASRFAYSPHKHLRPKKTKPLHRLPLLLLLLLLLLLRTPCVKCKQMAHASLGSTSAAATGATGLTTGRPPSKRTISKSAWRRTACSRSSRAPRAAGPWPRGASRKRPVAASWTGRASATPPTRHRCGAPMAAARPIAMTAERTGVNLPSAPPPQARRAGNPGYFRTVERRQAPWRVRA